METITNPTPGWSAERGLASLETFLREIIRAGKIELDFTIRKKAGEPAAPEALECTVDLTGREADILLEKNGAGLDALEHVALKAARLDEISFVKIVFDAKDWRHLRAEELKMIAQMAAARVLETGDPFELSPMTPRERRIVHLALHDDARLRTVSEGRGPERRVIIHPVHPPAPLRK